VRALTVLVPGRLDTLTGGYGYDRRIIQGLRGLGWSITVHELDASFPEPTDAALEHAARVVAGMADQRAVLVDGLAFGAMPALAAREAQRLRLIALVHHPLALESGVEPRLRERLFASEREALRSARRIVVTSRATATALSDYDVDSSRVDVIEPGTDPAPLATGSSGATVQLLIVAALIPRKGHEMLLRALAAIPERNWTLTCVGSADRHAETAAVVKELIRAGGLEGRVRLAGELEGDALASAYDAADVFVLPTLFEGYGMAVAEAVARGLPVIATNTGAIPDLLAGDAGLLLQPGDRDQLASALSRMLRDEELRRTVAANARRARARLTTWDGAARAFADVIDRVTR